MTIFAAQHIWCLVKQFSVLLWWYYADGNWLDIWLNDLLSETVFCITVVKVTTIGNLIFILHMTCFVKQFHVVRLPTGNLIYGNMAPFQLSHYGPCTEKRVCNSCVDFLVLSDVCSADKQQQQPPSCSRFYVSTTIIWMLFLKSTSFKTGFVKDLLVRMFPLGNCSNSAETTLRKKG